MAGTGLDVCLPGATGRRINENRDTGQNLYEFNELSLVVTVLNYAGLIGGDIRV